MDRNEFWAGFKRTVLLYIQTLYFFLFILFIFFVCGTQEDAAARVRARPLPAPSHGFCPQPSDRPLTETSEFCLSSQARHEKAAQEFQDRVRKEEERARRATEVSETGGPRFTGWILFSFFLRELGKRRFTPWTCAGS